MLGEGWGWAATSPKQLGVNVSHTRPILEGDSRGKNKVVSLAYPPVGGAVSSSYLEGEPCLCAAGGQDLCS